DYYCMIWHNNSWVF
nr:immunoglobulin light chain junction region [Macaca mulatta]